MKKSIAYSIAILIAGLLGLVSLFDGAFSEYVDINIAGDYYEQATSDDYRTIYSRTTDFSIPIRVDWYQSDARFIAVIKKQETNLDRRFGPCEFYVIDHVKSDEISKIPLSKAQYILRNQPELHRSFDKAVGERCNTAPVR